MPKNRHAQILGRKGGKKKSERKARAARLNGLLGGPQKPPMIANGKAYDVDTGEPRAMTAELVDLINEGMSLPTSFSEIERRIQQPAQDPTRQPQLQDGQQGNFRVPHDPRTCRLYRCGMCRALGHKDRNRGLL